MSPSLSLTRKSRPDPDTVYVALTAFGYASPSSGPTSVARGARFRGSSEIVQGTWGPLWGDADLSDEERSALWSKLNVAPSVPAPEPPPPPKMMRCIAPLVLRLGFGDEVDRVEVGDVLPEHHVIVVRHRRAFEPVE